jgi:hypothetical protein
MSGRGGAVSLSLSLCRVSGQFSRNELRTLLKHNGLAYHRGDGNNAMKSKSEMAADLLRLVGAAPPPSTRPPTPLPRRGLAYLDMCWIQ